MDLPDPISAVAAGRFRVTDHADEEMAADRLELSDVIRSIQAGQVIEDYPDDAPFPSCLVYGRDVSDKPVHSVWAYNVTSKWAVLVTVYRPDPQRWIEYRQRRPSS